MDGAVIRQNRRISLLMEDAEMRPASNSGAPHDDMQAQTAKPKDKKFKWKAGALLRGRAKDTDSDREMYSDDLSSPGTSPTNAEIILKASHKVSVKRTGSHHSQPDHYQQQLPPLRESSELPQTARQHPSAATAVTSLKHSNSVRSQSSPSTTTAVSSHGPPSSRRAYSTRRPHVFVPQGFIRPTKCDICFEKIWSLQGKDAKCQVCGFKAHAHCIGSAPFNCGSQHIVAPSNGAASQPQLSAPVDPIAAKYTNPQNQAPMFGRDLTEQVLAENRAVPWIVEFCIAAVETKGMDMEGIYRKSAPASEVRSFHRQLLENDAVDLGGLSRTSNAKPAEAEEIHDVSTVTSVLKQYLRDLPNPLLTYEAYDNFLEIARMAPSDARLRMAESVLVSLPQANQDTIRYLMHHLARVAQRSARNLMNSKNLAVVFGPTILRGRDLDADQEFSDMASKNGVVEFLIREAARLWPETAPSNGSGDGSSVRSGGGSGRQRSNTVGSAAPTTTTTDDDDDFLKTWNANAIHDYVAPRTSTSTRASVDQRSVRHISSISDRNIDMASATNLRPLSTSTANHSHNGLTPTPSYSNLTLY